MASIFLKKFAQKIHNSKDGFIVPGAPVNLGNKKGIAKRFEDDISPRKMLVIHCANHR